MRVANRNDGEPPDSSFSLSPYPSPQPPPSLFYSSLPFVLSLLPRSLARDPPAAAEGEDAAHGEVARQDECAHHQQVERHTEQVRHRAAPCQGEKGRGRCMKEKNRQGRRESRVDAKKRKKRNNGERQRHGKEGWVEVGAAKNETAECKRSLGLFGNSQVVGDLHGLEGAEGRVVEADT